MAKQQQDWIVKMRAELVRYRDEIRAGYVGIRGQAGSDVANALLGELGKAITVALDEWDRRATPARAPEEDSFG